MIRLRIFNRDELTKISHTENPVCYDHNPRLGGACLLYVWFRVSDPYEPSEQPEVRLHTDEPSTDECLARLLATLPPIIEVSRMFSPLPQEWRVS